MHASICSTRRHYQRSLTRSTGMVAHRWCEGTRENAATVSASWTHPNQSSCAEGRGNRCQRASRQHDDLTSSSTWWRRGWSVISPHRANQLLAASSCVVEKLASSGVGKAIAAQSHHGWPSSHAPHKTQPSQIRGLTMSGADTKSPDEGLHCSVWERV